MTTREIAEKMSGAVFDELVLDGKVVTYRYALWRIWNPRAVEEKHARLVMFILMNGSTAGRYHDDPTTVKCAHYGQSWGYDGMYIGNLYAQVATHFLGPNYSLAVGEHNDEWLYRMRDLCELHVAGWGSAGNWMPARTKRVMEMFPKLHYLELMGNGYPKHPLYLASTLVPTPWEEKKPAKKGKKNERQ